MDAKTFYGVSYHKATDPAKLDQAYERLQKALGTSNESLADKMITLAAKGEREAFQ
jgi:hypothetical protein